MNCSAVSFRDEYLRDIVWIDGTREDLLLLLLLLLLLKCN